MTKPQFEIVQDDEPSKKTDKSQSAAISALMLALGALSNKALIALSRLYSLLTIVSAWYLFIVTLPNPTTYQLVGLGLYCALILAVNLIIRRE